MTRRLLSSLFVFVVFAPLRASAVELVTNGDFSGGLTGWSASGSVDASTSEAVLTDVDCGTSPCARLFQGISADAGTYTLSFDILNNLSGNVDQGAFPDTVFGTLFFTTDLGTFDIDNLVFDSAVATFDADQFSGVSDLPVGASLDPSAAKGTGWLHFSMSLVIASTTFVIPTFELFDLNGFLGDSEFRVDNVSLTKEDQTGVPEPASLFLLGCGSLLGLSRRRRVRC